MPLAEYFAFIQCALQATIGVVIGIILLEMYIEYVADKRTN